MENDYELQRLMNQEKNREPAHGYVLVNDSGEILAKGTKRSLDKMRTNCEMTSFRVAPQSSMDM